MSRQVVWADTAQADYLSILRYIAGRNPDAAERVAARIENAVASLGQVSAGRPGRVSGTYEKVLPGLFYILAYEIIIRSDGSEVIAILQIIHSARNWLADEWPIG